jgi:hypothetical protein
MNSRDKGQRGEREWAGVLSARFPALEFKRGIQTRAGGKEAADVMGLPGWHGEVKRVEKLNIWSALSQAESDAKGVDYYVAFRRNHGPWYVAIPAETWLNLIAQDIPTGFPTGPDLAQTAEEPIPHSG